jgi:hypothetical protein
MKRDLGPGIFLLRRADNILVPIKIYASPLELFHSGCLIRVETTLALAYGQHGLSSRIAGLVLSIQFRWHG